MAVRGQAALVWVEGADAAGFLQGLLSNDVAGLAVGASCPALLLDAKGHVQVDPRVYRDGDDAFTLVVEPDLADLLAGLLERYHFSEVLERIGPEPSDVVTVAGLAGDPSGAADLVLGGRVPGTVDLVSGDAGATLAALAVPEVAAEALEVVRIEAGVPRIGVDTGPVSLVQEAGLEATAVSFAKGCYLGQETVARTAYRGRVNRRLRGLMLSTSARVGAAVTGGERELGHLTSVALSPGLGPIALAMLRREAAPGDRVGVVGVAGGAQVVELPFAA